MHCNYADIRDRIPEEPQWWDENAVPRYCAFSPRECANIYADEAALVLIACQSCQQRFRVAFSESSSWRVVEARESLANQISADLVHYGDPPNIRCCPAGPTMNCDGLRVLEYWHRGDDFEWKRDPSFEIALGRDRV